MRGGSQGYLGTKEEGVWGSKYINHTYIGIYKYYSVRELCKCISLGNGKLGPKIHAFNIEYQKAEPRTL